MKKTSYTTLAPFQVNGRWRWVTWTHHEANKHAAIIVKAAELKATAWDFGQADHHPTSQFPFATR